MNRIQMDEKYVITSDERCWTLGRMTVNKKTGRPKLRPVTYHATYELAVREYARRSLLGGNATNHEELLSLAKEIEARLSSGADSRRLDK